MKEIKHSLRQMIPLALAGLAILTPLGSAVAQTVTAQLGDLVLGVYATNNPDIVLEVDLGSVSNFYNAAPGSTIPLPGLSVNDLSDSFGSDWYTHSDLFWGAVASDGRYYGTPDGHASLATLWATDPIGNPAFTCGSVYAQKQGSRVIEAMFEPTYSGSLDGATATANSSTAAEIYYQNTGSYYLQDYNQAGVSFGFFNPTVDNVGPTNGQAVSALYELQPSNPSGAAAKLLGNLILTQTGLVFQAAVGTPAPLNILSITRSVNDITLTWTAPGGTTNRVQAVNTNNYSTSGFANISTQIFNSGIASTAVTNTYTDSFGATNRPARFYRVYQTP
jgi:hypothetical protein